MKKEIKRIEKILEKLPLIRKLIKDGYGWEVLKGICEPLGLDDTSFRENPRLDDFLVDEKYWQKRILEIAKGDQSEQQNLN